MARLLRPLFSLFLLFFLLIVTLFAYVAIAHSQPRKSPNTNNSSDIVFAIQSAPRTLDPRFATDATSFRIAQLLYKAPVRFDNQSNPTQWLCQWQQINNSHAHYRFWIAGNPTFSDGQAITIDDVIATYQSVLDKNTGSPHRGSLSNIQKMIKIDTKTVDFILKKPDILFPGSLVIGVMAKAQLQKKNIHHNSSGDFTLHQWDGEGDVFLNRRKDNKRFQFLISKNDTVSALQILKGNIDIMQSGLSQELIEYLSKQKNLTVQSNLGSTYTYLGTNMQDKILSKLKIRQALSLGIDRQEIIDHLFNKRARLAQALLPKEHWSSDNTLQGITYDPQQARAILNTLGYNAQNPLKLSYKTSKLAFRLRIATLLQHQLKKIHIHTTIQSYDWGTFYGDIKRGNFQLYSLSWVGIKQPDIYRYVFHSSMIPPKGANRGRYVNKEADYLIKQGDDALTIEKKQHYYYRLQRLLKKDLPYIPLWYENQYAILSQKAKNYQLPSDGNFLNLSSLKIQIM